MTVRRTTIALTVAAVLLAILFFAVPVLIKVDRYRPQVISYLQQKTGKQIEIQRLGLTFFPLSIRVDGFGIVNPPLFPRGYVVHVARIDAALDAAALRHRQVVIKSLVLDNPVIHLISDPDGPWNFENPQAGSSQKMFPLEPIANVQIKRGEVTASNLLPSDAPGPVLFEAHDISSELANVNLEAIINPSSASVDAVGALEVRTLTLRFGSRRKCKYQAPPRGKADRLQQCHRTNVWGSVNGEFVFKLSGKTPSFATKAEVHGIEMAHLLAAFGNAHAIMTGKMAGDLTLVGDIEHSSHPLEGMRGAGHVTVRNGQVAES